MTDVGIGWRRWVRLGSERALRTPSGVAMPVTSGTRAARRQQRGARRRTVVGVVLTLLVMVSVPLLLAVARRGSDGDGRPVTKDEALAVVRAAIGHTLSSGSYETDNTNSSTPATDPQASTCPVAASCRPAGSSFGATSHGIVNVDPFVTRIDSQDSYGAHTLYVSATTVWLSGQEPNAPAGPGVSLPQFASSVTGALGPSAGALAMVGLASPGGSLNLEEAAIAGASPAGTGAVDGVPVTSYDVAIDMTALRNTPNLSDAQRRTIEDALPLLERGGYRGTTERIGIDDAGYVREVTATARFDDGSTSIRHTVFSSFGCAPQLTTPERGVVPTVTGVPCEAPATTTTTAAPTPTTSTTSTSAPTTTAPTNSGDAAAIEAAYLGWLNAQPKDDLVGVVEDFASITDSLRQGMAQHSPEDLARYSGRVESIEVVDAAHANVTYSVLFNGVPQFSRQPGQAVKLDGRWMVSRSTVCALLTHGGITCPPQAG